MDFTSVKSPIKKGWGSSTGCLASPLYSLVFKRLFQRQVYGYTRPEHQRPNCQVIAQTHSIFIDEDCLFKDSLSREVVA
jgi:hypothetical protein